MQVQTPSAEQVDIFLTSALGISTETRLSSQRIPRRASTQPDGKRMRLRNGKELRYFIGLIVWQAAWAAEDREGAETAIREAIAAGYPEAQGTPSLDGRLWKQARTLAEALKASRNSSFRTIFGDELFVDDAFGYSLSTPAVWIDAKLLPPTVVRVYLDGQEVRDARKLSELALRLLDVEDATGW